MGAIETEGWRAELDLRYERRGERTVLAARSHRGPLGVQRPFYPEGGVCHSVLLHPPGGVCGGDTLDIAVDLGSGAHALLTTPGAGKWYRSAGAGAAQRVHLSAGPQAMLEWLPQESIVFDGARAQLSLEVDLAAGARYIGWEVLCLGRSAAGERYTHGSLGLANRLRRQGRLLWQEQGRIEGGSPLLDCPAGLGGCPASALLVAAADELPDELLAACREPQPAEGRAGVTRLPGVLLARWVGHEAECGRRWLAALWRVLRPALAGREAVSPRIWNT